jgi:hypothetical protein
MLAAQVNAHKYDSLNTIFGIGWNGAPIVCEAHLECGWIALVGAVGGMRVILTDELPPHDTCLLELCNPPCNVFGSGDGWKLAALNSCLVLLVGL